ncbi:glycosyltransferase family 4 protein [Ramlibacter sp.]|uniref:glycosyltransferase family 4 protein n=1 Tax=Ramlibacter sp. TaxID=1917967 RepID=UPI002622E68A|nr:glycosyltransferase family 4 protein [Ramlibacter sp.]
MLVVSPYYASHGGGVEMVAGQLASGLAARGFEVTWAASDTDAAATDDGVLCIPMRANNAIEKRTGVPVPLWTPGAMRQLWRAIRACDVVLMHESLYLANLWAAGSARILGKPLLLVQHVGEVPYRSRALRTVVRAGNALAARFAQLCAARVVFVSAVVKDYFCAGRPANASRQLLIPNGFDPARFHPAVQGERERTRARLGISGSRPALLFVGRFVEKKGLRLLEALARQRPEWQFIFVGSGPLDPGRWGLPQVRVVGRISQEQLPDWYRAADLLVLPSTGEGFPLVVQEAMACGLPAAVASETARALEGVREMVFSDRVDADDPRTLQRWLDLLDGALASDLAARRHEVARFASEQWSWRRCVEHYANVIESVVRP